MWCSLHTAYLCLRTNAVRNVNHLATRRTTKQPKLFLLQNTMTALSQISKKDCSKPTPHIQDVIESKLFTGLQMVWLPVYSATKNVGSEVFQLLHRYPSPPVLKKWQNSSMKRTAGEGTALLCHRLMALPVLPHQHIQPMYNQLKSSLDGSCKEHSVGITRLSDVGLHI